MDIKAVLCLKVLSREAQGMILKIKNIFTLNNSLFRSDWEEVTGIKVMILEAETTTPEMISSSSQSTDVMSSDSWTDTGTTRWSSNDYTSPSYDVYLTSEEPTPAGQDIKQYSDQSDDKEPYKRLEAEQGGWKTKNSAADQE